MAEVTVVIPTKNRRAMLARTLHSVLHQRDVDIDVVVVDDGGSDGTGAAVAGLGDDRVSLLRHEVSQGVSAARNAGIAVASTPWLAFVDDDDLWGPSKLRSQLDALGRNPEASWSCVGTVYIDERCRVLSRAEVPESSELGDTMLQFNAIPGGGSGVLASRELTEQVSGFDESISNLADWDFYIRLAMSGRLAAVPDYELGYWRHPAGMAHAVRQSAIEYDYLRVKYERQRRTRRVRLDEYARLDYLARMSYRGGNRVAALGMHAELVLLDRRRRSVVALAKGPVPSRLRDAVGRRRNSLPGRSPQSPSRTGLDWLEPYSSGWLEPHVVSVGGNYHW